MYALLGLDGAELVLVTFRGLTTLAPGEPVLVASRVNGLPLPTAREKHEVDRHDCRPSLCSREMNRGANVTLSER